MTRLHISLPSLVHGVSQLSAAERQPVHALASDNCWPTVESGDMKRPPLIHVAKVFTGTFGDSYCHGMDRGSGERHIGLFKFGATTNNGLIFDTSGAVIPVFKNTGTYAAPVYTTTCDYIYLSTGSNPTSTIRAITALDYTFIVNRNIGVTMSNSTTTDSPTDTAHVFIRQGAFSMKYSVRIKTNTVDTTVNAHTFDSISNSIKTEFPTGTAVNGAQGCFVWDTTRPDPSTGGDQCRSSVKTQDIANRLLEGLSGNLSTILIGNPKPIAAGKLTVTQNGSVIKIVSNDGPITKFEVTTAQGDQLAFGIQNETTAFSNLPLIFTHGYVVKIKGNSIADEDDFYVKFTGVDSAITTLQAGTWSETVKPGIKHTWVYTPSSFHPHALVRRVWDGTDPLTIGVSGVEKVFTFEPINLDSRLVGDTTSNPDPSFVSRTAAFTPGAGGGGTSSIFPVVRKIQECTFFRDRLVFCSDEFVVCSEQAVYFNFFRTTVRALPDTDPIDVALSSDRVTKIHSMVPFAGRLVLFSSEAQHQLGGSPNLTPSAVESTEISHYNSISDCRPIAYEDGILFANQQGVFSGLRSLTPTQQSEENFTAVDLSIHTPSYIEGTVKQISVTTDSSVIACLGTTDVDAIYVLKQHREGEKVIQSAWTRFVVDGATAIYGIEFFDTKLYCVVQRSDGVYLEYMDLAYGVSDVNGAHWLYLDRRETNPSHVNGATTTITMSYPIEAGATMEVVTYPGELRFVGTPTAGNDFTVATNLTGLTFVAGRKYTSTHSFHKPQVQVDSNNGRRLVLDSTSAVISLALRYENTAYFKIVTGSESKAVGSSTDGQFTATDLSEPASGTVVVGVGGRLDSPFAVSVQNDSPFPHTLVSGEWLVNANMRSKALL